MPIYRVNVKVKESAETRLVDAPTTAAAMRFAGEKVMTVERCTISEAVELGRQGIQVESAE